MFSFLYALLECAPKEFYHSRRIRQKLHGEFVKNTNSKKLSSTSDKPFKEIRSPDQLRYCRHPYDLEGRGVFFNFKKMHIL